MLGGSERRECRLVDEVRDDGDTVAANAIVGDEEVGDTPAVGDYTI